MSTITTLTTTTPGAVAQLAMRQRVYSPNLLAELQVCGLTYGQVPVEAVLSGDAQPVEATLSHDGRHWLAAWHEGPESAAPSVYVERVTAEGVAMHGWVDAESRRLVQVG